MDLFKKNTEKFVDLQVYAIYDSKSGAYQMPIFGTNHLVISRELEQLFSDPNQQKGNFLVSNPEDYTLFKIGEYDRKSGKLTEKTPESIFNLLEIKSMITARQNTAPLRDVSQ